VSGVAARRVPVEKRTLVWRSYDAFNRRDPDAAVPPYTPGCRWTMDHFGGWPDDRDEALAAAGLTPGRPVGG